MSDTIYLSFFLKIKNDVANSATATKDVNSDSSLPNNIDIQITRFLHFPRV